MKGEELKIRTFLRTTEPINGFTLHKILFKKDETPGTEGLGR
jgi:hypothetical protein